MTVNTLAGGLAALPLLLASVVSAATPASPVAAATATSPGAHPAEVEARLAATVGDWTIAGREASYRETCEWFGDRAFVVCRSTGADGSSSVGVLGWSRRDGHFTYYRYFGRGGSRHDNGFPSGANGIAWTSESRTAAGGGRTTTVTTPLADGRMHVRQERSVNGGPWTESENFHYVRRAPEAEGGG
ncbi:MAG: hypothetical protein ACK53C_17005 [Pseudomonadota bacterium]